MFLKNDMTHRFRKKSLGAVMLYWLPLLGFFLTLSHDTYAGGFAVTTFGSRRTGMLANLASTDELTALFHNPAALGSLTGYRLHLSCSWSFSNAEFEIQALDPERFPEVACTEESCDWPVGDDGYYTRIIEPTSTMGFLPYLGLSMDLGQFYDALEGIVIAASVTAPNVYAAALPENAPSSYFVIEGYFLVLSTIVGLGWKINDVISIGGNVHYNYMRLAYARRFSLADLLRGRDGSGNAFVADLAQSTIGDVRLDYMGIDHGVGWTISMLLSPTSWFSWGISYTHTSAIKFEGDATITTTREDVTREDLDEMLEFYEVVAGDKMQLPSGLIVAMTIPPFLSTGINFHPSPYFEIGFDVRLWFYNIYKRRVVEPIYDEEGIQPITQEQLSQEMNYDVSFDLSLGVLFRPVRRIPSLEFMAGVGFDKSPVPDANFSLENVSMDNWRFALGIRWAPPQGFRIALTYMFFGYIERDVTNSASHPPLNVRGRGNNQFPRLEVEYVF